jgi:acyl-CoA thioester hydrolase
MAIDFGRPARVDDSLLVRTRVREVTGARMKLAQAILRQDEELVTAEVEVCVVTLEGRLRRIPDEIRAKLEAFCQT